MSAQSTITIRRGSGGEAAPEAGPYRQGVAERATWRTDEHTPSAFTAEHVPGGRTLTAGLVSGIVVPVHTRARYYDQDGLSFGVGADEGHVYTATVRAATEEAENDTVAVMRMLLATWLVIRQPASRRSLHQVEHLSAPRASARRIERAGGDPTRTVDYVTLRRYEAPTGAATGARPAHGDGTGRTYTVRWWVSPHRITRHWPSTGDSKRVWRGPYLATPEGCESAPIQGEERVYVLRR